MESKNFENLNLLQGKSLAKVGQHLNGIIITNNKKGKIMDTNIGGGELKELKPRILVMGVGGAGGNAINSMIRVWNAGVEFVAVNTDAQDLRVNKSRCKNSNWHEFNKGLGAGAKSDIGQAAADESLNEIVSFIQGSNDDFYYFWNGGGI